MIKDDLYLLEQMIYDSKNQPDIYKPGKYWERHVKTAVNEIIEHGLNNFRGSDNLIGMGYADNNHLDVRNSLNRGYMKAFKAILSTFPFNRVFDAQVAWTKSYNIQMLRAQNEFLKLNPRTKYLLSKYKIPDSLEGGCQRTAKIGGVEYSTHYLNLLDIHDRMAEKIDFTKIKSVFEIGGGFGANVHILLNNYPNIKKVLYLDIPPNLYVSTQYLKAFYPYDVFDYARLDAWNCSEFHDDDELEIFCMAPWQIEKFENHFDLFMNSNSFVEMPARVIENYVKHIDADTIALSSYDCFDLNTTISPYRLPEFFKGRRFDVFEAPMLLDSLQKNIYFISKK